MGGPHRPHCLACRPARRQRGASARPVRKAPASIERIAALAFRFPIEAVIGPIASTIWAMDAAEHVLVTIIDADGVVGRG